MDDELINVHLAINVMMNVFSINKVYVYDNNHMPIHIENIHSYHYSVSLNSDNIIAYLTLYRDFNNILDDIIKDDIKKYYSVIGMINKYFQVDNFEFYNYDYDYNLCNALNDIFNF